MGTQSASAGSKRKLALKSILALVLAGVVWVPLWPAQSSTPDWQTAAGGKMTFDVASVSQNTTAPSPHAWSSNFPLGPGDVYVPNAGQFRAVNFPLVAYID